MYYLRVSIAAILFSLTLSGHDLDYSSQDIFPVHDEMVDACQFWITVFTRYSTNEYIIHDSKDLGVIYEVVKWGSLDDDFDTPQTREQKQFFKSKLNYYEKILTELATLYPDTTLMSREHKRVYKLLSRVGSRNDFYTAANRLRIQKGQRNRFLRGLEISGRYMPFLKEIFRKYKLPEELTLLPHVESSFNYKAYSSAGAAGIWQFTRGTGKQYLKISYEVDERLDPILATEAAARLLQENYRQLGKWPLAITAYNHGLQGMKRAVNKIHSKNLNTIIKNYRSRYFKFASRNFYCEFVAVVHIVQNFEDYFDQVDFESPLIFNELVLPQYIKYATLSSYLNINDQLFRKYNPALRNSVYNNSKYIPTGYRLRIPSFISPDSLLALIPKKEYYTNQKRSKYYQVRYGDTLSEIAVKFGTSVNTLLVMNNLSNEHYIRRGMTLRIPDKKEESAILASADIRPARSAPKITSPPPDQIAESVPDNSDDHSGGNNQPSGTTVLQFANGKTSDDLDLEIIQTNPPAGYIRVEPEETLGHYADWLQIRTQRIRDWNGFSFRRAINLDQKIKLVFDQVTPEEFNRLRLEYHRGIEEDFFLNYEITGTSTHQVKTGENLWYLCTYVYNLPYWLIVAYNKDIDFNQLKVGDPLIIPEIRTKEIPDM